MNDIEAAAILTQRVNQLDQTLFMGLKCITVLLEDLEMATRDDGTVSIEERDIARNRVRELVATMKKMF